MPVLPSPDRFRQIHLDFHTSPHILDVASKFDPGEFARTLRDAHVGSVTLFAKCHHGHLYFNTPHPARHPGLPANLNLLREQTDALHKHDIRAVIYISVQCDEFAANAHPDWIVVNPDGTRLAPAPFTREGATWQILDMSSPYQDYLADQLGEVLSQFSPCDGLFFDMCWTQPSCSKYAVEGMRERGLDPASLEERSSYAEGVAQDYMARFTRLAREAHSGKELPIFFNGRSWTNLAADKKHLSHLEIEALATGVWGYMFFPQFVRLARSYRMPMLGMTGRFHKSWADFGGIKPQAALMYECAQMLAHGAGCSVGDQLHPKGNLDRASYELIGSVYRYVEDCEPWCRAPEFRNEIAVIFSQENGQRSVAGGTNEGVVRALQELHYQFDFVAPGDANLGDYDLVIVPESVRVDAILQQQLERFADRGGALLIAGDALLGFNQPASLARMGIESLEESPFSTSYIRFAHQVQPWAEGTDHVMYDRGLRLTPTGDARTIAWVVEPYFERSWKHFCSHYQTPPDRLSAHAAAIVSNRMASIASPIFKAYAQHGSLPYRALIRECISSLLPEPQLMLIAPSHVESTTYWQNDRQIIHLLSYAPRRRALSVDIVEEPTECLNVKVLVRVNRIPRRAYLATQQIPIELTIRGNRADFTLDVLRGHQIIVIE
jgi:hypothetical protein